MKLVEHGILVAIQKDKTLAKGVNTYLGKTTYDAVAETFGLEYTPLESIVS
jgi:alanine dehydrogenase